MKLTRRLAVVARYRALIDALLNVLENKQSPETAKAHIRIELQRMAVAADSYIEGLRPRRKYTPRKSKGGGK